MMIKFAADGLVTWPKQASSKFPFSLVKKPKMEKKWRFVRHPVFSLRHKNHGDGYGYDKTRTKVMARDINKTQKLWTIFHKRKEF